MGLHGFWWRWRFPVDTVGKRDRAALRGVHRQSQRQHWRRYPSGLYIYELSRKVDGCTGSESARSTWRRVRLLRERPSPSQYPPLEELVPGTNTGASNSDVSLWRVLFAAMAVRQRHSVRE